MKDRKEALSRARRCRRGGSERAQSELALWRGKHVAKLWAPPLKQPPRAAAAPMYYLGGCLLERGHLLHHELVALAVLPYPVEPRHAEVRLRRQSAARAEEAPTIHRTE